MMPSIFLRNEMVMASSETAATASISLMISFSSTIFSKRIDSRIASQSVSVPGEFLDRRVWILLCLTAVNKKPC